VNYSIDLQACSSKGSPRSGLEDITQHSPVDDERAIKLRGKEVNSVRKMNYKAPFACDIRTNVTSLWTKVDEEPVLTSHRSLFAKLNFLVRHNLQPISYCHS
jgi:hypothetical protein